MLNFSNGVSFAALIILTAIWIMPAAAAQDALKQQASQGQRNPSDEDLKNFAKAYVEYHQIRQTYEKRLNDAQYPGEREKVQLEGDSKVSKALEKQGVTPESYNRLFAVVNGNEQLRKKALRLIEDERKNS